MNIVTADADSLISQLRSAHALWVSHHLSLSIAFTSAYPTIYPFFFILVIFYVNLGENNIKTSQDFL